MLLEETSSTVYNLQGTLRLWKNLIVNCLFTLFRQLLTTAKQKQT